jgi:uncharacterized membrane protein
VNVSENLVVSESAHTGISENALGALSYLTVIPAILFLAVAPYNRSAYVRFHAWQSIIIGAVAFLINFGFSSLLPMTGLFGQRMIVLFTGIIGLAYTITMILFAVRALNGKRSKLPMIGTWADHQASR